MESGTYKDDKTGRTEHYSYSTPFYYSFEKNGQGNMFREGTSSVAFTYKYNNKDKTIAYQRDGEQGIWFIDILTEDTLIFHGERDHQVPTTDIVYHLSATYKGKRI